METTTVPAVTLPARTPLSRRYLWLAVIIAGALPVILLGAMILLLMAGNYNFLEWME